MTDFGSLHERSAGRSSKERSASMRRMTGSSSQRSSTSTTMASWAGGPDGGYPVAKTAKQLPRRGPPESRNAPHHSAACSVAMFLSALSRRPGDAGFGPSRFTQAGGVIKFKVMGKGPAVEEPARKRVIQPASRHDGKPTGQQTGKPASEANRRACHERAKELWSQPTLYSNDIYHNMIRYIMI